MESMRDALGVPLYESSAPKERRVEECDSRGSLRSSGRRTDRQRLLDSRKAAQHVSLDAIELAVQLGHLELRLEVDLVLDVVLHPIARDLTILREEHEDRQDDRFERHDHRQEPE